MFKNIARQFDIDFSFKLGVVCREYTDALCDLLVVEVQPYKRSPIVVFIQNCTVTFSITKRNISWINQF